MKKWIITGVLMTTVSITQAQFLELGVKSGVQLTNDPQRLVLSEGYLTDMGLNTAIGAYLTMNFGRLYVQPDFMFSNTNFVPVQEYSFSDVALFNVNRFDLPLVIGYTFFDFLKLEAGPSYYNVKETEEENLFRLKNLQKEFTAGVGIEIHKVQIGARAVNSFDQLFDAQQTTWQFTLMYEIF